MHGIGNKYGLAAWLPALVLAIGLVFAGSALAAKQSLQTGIFGDSDAKLSIVLQKSKSGKPSKVQSLHVTDYDLRCQTLNLPDTQKTFQVDFSFPAIDVKREQKGKYRYSFSGQAGQDDPFTEGYYSHGGLGEGWFATNKKGKVTKLVGYLAMGGLSTSLPGVPPPASCADPVRDDPFAKQHGSFSVSLG